MLSGEEGDELPGVLQYRTQSWLGAPQGRACNRSASQRSGATPQRPDRADLVREGLAAAVPPIELLLAVVRGEAGADRFTSRQIEAAKAALPYVSRRR